MSKKRLFPSDDRKLFGSKIRTAIERLSRKMSMSTRKTKELLSRAFDDMIEGKDDSPHIMIEFMKILKDDPDYDIKLATDEEVDIFLDILEDK